MKTYFVCISDTLHKLSSNCPATAFSAS